MPLDAERASVRKDSADTVRVAQQNSDAAASCSMPSLPAAVQLKVSGLPTETVETPSVMGKAISNIEQANAVATALRRPPSNPPLTSPLRSPSNFRALPIPVPFRFRCCVRSCAA